MIKQYMFFLGGFVLGGFVLVLGVLFNVLFAGIPYQSDAPDALKLQYVINTNIANAIYLVGLAIILAGVLIQIVLRIKKK